MKPIANVVSPSDKEELIEIDFVVYNNCKFMLPDSIWLKYFTGGRFNVNTENGVMLIERGVIKFPNGYAIQATFPVEGFKESLVNLIAPQIGEAVMTPEDNKHIYTSFLRENFKHIKEHITETLKNKDVASIKL